MSEGLRAVASTERLSCREVSFVMMFLANSDFFLRFAEMIVSADNSANRDSTLCRRQIWCWQIVSFNFLANRPSANCYAPNWFLQFHC